MDTDGFRLTTHGLRLTTYDLRLSAFGFRPSAFGSYSTLVPFVSLVLFVSFAQPRPWATISADGQSPRLHAWRWPPSATASARVAARTQDWSRMPDRRVRDRLGVAGDGRFPGGRRVAAGLDVHRHRRGRTRRRPS